MAEPVAPRIIRDYPRYFSHVNRFLTDLLYVRVSAPDKIHGIYSRGPAKTLLGLSFTDILEFVADGHWTELTQSAALALANSAQRGSL